MSVLNTGDYLKNKCWLIRVLIITMFLYNLYFLSKSKVLDDKIVSLYHLITFSLEIKNDKNEQKSFNFLYNIRSLINLLNSCNYNFSEESF